MAVDDPPDPSGPAGPDDPRDPRWRRSGAGPARGSGPGERDPGDPWEGGPDDPRGADEPAGNSGSEGRRETNGRGGLDNPGGDHEQPGGGLDPSPLDGLGGGLDPDHELEEPEELDEDASMQTVVTVEINGLSLYTHHGVTEAERDVGQRLVLDIRLDMGETDATVTDLLEDTVDYAEVCQLVALIAQQRSYRTLERLCSAIADRLLSDFDVEGVSVKASKPEPPIPLPVEEVTVEVWREPGE